MGFFRRVCGCIHACCTWPGVLTCKGLSQRMPEPMLLNPADKYGPIINLHALVLAAQAPRTPCAKDSGVQCMTDAAQTDCTTAGIIAMHAPVGSYPLQAAGDDLPLRGPGFSYTDHCSPRTYMLSSGGMAGITPHSSYYGHYHSHSDSPRSELLSNSPSYSSLSPTAWSAAAHAPFHDSVTLTPPPPGGWCIRGGVVSGSDSPAAAVTDDVAFTIPHPLAAGVACGSAVNTMSFAAQQAAAANAERFAIQLQVEREQLRKERLQLHEQIARTSVESVERLKSIRYLMSAYRERLKGVVIQGKVLRRILVLGHILADFATTDITHEGKNSQRVISAGDARQILTEYVKNFGALLEPEAVEGCAEELQVGVKADSM